MILKILHCDIMIVSRDVTENRFHVWVYLMLYYAYAKFKGYTFSRTEIKQGAECIEYPRLPKASDILGLIG